MQQGCIWVLQLPPNSNFMDKKMTQVWFITGSSRGLGRDLVEAALAAGHAVVATARKPRQLDDLAGKYGDRLLPLALDVNDADAVQVTIDKAADRFGRIDVVVNNAGYGNIASVEDITLKDFEEQVQTNFFGVVYVCKAVIPLMRKQGSGVIFQIASVGARMASPGLTAYQAAKFAVRGFSLGFAQEVAPFGIKISTIEPGAMRTDWAGSSMEIPPISEPYQQTVGACADMLRQMSGTQPIDPVKVANVLVDLAGSEDIPNELLIGTDAVEYASAFAKALAETDAQWLDVSTSVNYDEAD